MVSSDSASSVIAEAGTPTFKESVFGDVTYGGVTSPVNDRLWDSDKNRACVCDPGYSGIDCSLRACPVGDVPLTWDASSCGGSPHRRGILGLLQHAHGFSDPQPILI
jgi:hypothetical protein